MARFFFHQQTPRGSINDPDGSELDDMEAARAEAITAARHMWAAAILAGDDISEWSFEVADADGRHLMSIPFRDALPVSLRG